MYLNDVLFKSSYIMNCTCMSLYLNGIDMNNTRETGASIIFVADLIKREAATKKGRQ